MKVNELRLLIKEIVERATELKNKHTDQSDALVNYSCIFSQSNDEFEHLVKTSNKIGKVIKETPTGPIFHIKPLETLSGKLLLLKVRKPDPTRPERGDADFTVSNYSKFKKKYLSRVGFKWIERKSMEMIELVDPAFEVRVYFSDPPLDKQLRIS